MEISENINIVQKRRGEEGGRDEQREFKRKGGIMRWRECKSEGVRMVKKQRRMEIRE